MVQGYWEGLKTAVLEASQCDNFLACSQGLVSLPPPRCDKATLYRQASSRASFQADVFIWQP